MTLELNNEKYSKYKTWGEFYPNKVVNLKKLNYHRSWADLFDKLFADERFKNLEAKLSSELEDDSDVIIHPAPELVFNSFFLTPLDKVSVVFIGQDPYFSHSKLGGRIVHQAMGLSFSVPHGTEVPSSLQNVYRNMVKYNVIKKKPTHGNLEFWALQGCLMLNSALTVKDGPDNKNCHQNNWRWFTNAVIKYISDNKKGVVFVLWGKDAYDKMSLIDLDEHEVIASSHPSGLSCNKTMGKEPAFDDLDHFNKINEYVKKAGKEPIVWQL